MYLWFQITINIKNKKNPAPSWIVINMHFMHKTEWAVNLTLSYIYWYMNLHNGISSSLVEMEEMIEFYFDTKNKSNLFINELIIRISYFILWLNTPSTSSPTHISAGSNSAIPCICMICMYTTSLWITQSAQNEFMVKFNVFNLKRQIVQWNARNKIHIPVYVDIHVLINTNPIQTRIKKNFSGEI